MGNLREMSVGNFIRSRTRILTKMISSTHWPCLFVCLFVSFSFIWLGLERFSLIFARFSQKVFSRAYLSERICMAKIKALL